jgi:hypothetical protein
MITALTSNQPNPYVERKEAILSGTAIGLVDTVDAYVGSVQAFVPLAHPYAAMGGCIALAAAHGISAIAHFAIGSDLQDESIGKSAMYGAVTGELLTCAGFAALAGGVGPWALPILGLGMATTTFCRLA